MSINIDEGAARLTITDPNLFIKRMIIDAICGTNLKKVPNYVVEHYVKNGIMYYFGDSVLVRRGNLESINDNQQLQMIYVDFNISSLKESGLVNVVSII